MLLMVLTEAPQDTGPCGFNWEPSASGSRDHLPLYPVLVSWHFYGYDKPIRGQHTQTSWHPSDSDVTGTGDHSGGHCPSGR